MLRVEKLFYSSFSHLQLSITHVIISKESAVPQVPRHVFEDEKLSKRHVLEECKTSKRHVSTILWGFCIYSCRNRQGHFHGRHDHRRLGRRQDRPRRRERRGESGANRTKANGTKTENQDRRAGGGVEHSRAGEKASGCQRHAPEGKGHSRERVLVCEIRPQSACSVRCSSYSVRCSCHRSLRCLHYTTLSRTKHSSRTKHQAPSTLHTNESAKGYKRNFTESDRDTPPRRRSGRTRNRSCPPRGRRRSG